MRLPRFRGIKSFVQSHTVTAQLEPDSRTVLPKLGLLTQIPPHGSIKAYILLSLIYASGELVYQTISSTGDKHKFPYGVGRRRQ